MAVVPLAIHLSGDLWRTVHALAPHDGDSIAIIRRAVEADVTATAKYLDACGPVTAGSSTIQWRGTSGL